VKNLFYLNRPEERHSLEGRHLFGGDILAGTFAVRQCQLLRNNNIFGESQKTKKIENKYLLTKN
jgi:hypothetical protein